MEQSLRRLNLDAIDLYQIHWPEPDHLVEAAWALMAKLREEGKVRHIGMSNFNVDQMRRAQAIAPITSLQPPYSILSPEIGKERIAARPADDFRQRMPNFKEPLLSRNLQVAELLGAIGKRHGRTAGEVAIAWTLRHPAVTGAIVGMRSAKQVEGVIGAAEFRLSADEIGEIERFMAPSAATMTA